MRARGLGIHIVRESRQRRPEAAHLEVDIPHVLEVGVPVGPRVRGRVLHVHPAGLGRGPAAVSVDHHHLGLGLAAVELLEVLLHLIVQVLDGGLSVEPARQHVEEVWVAVRQAGEPILNIDVLDLYIYKVA